MLGFENTSDLLIVAIIAHTIVIALIILIIYFKIKKIQYKDLNLNEKIEYKINNIESKLSYLYDQALTTSTNQDKFGPSIDSMEDPASNYRFKESTDYESDSLDHLTDPTLESQRMADSETIDARLSTIPKPKNSENNSIPISGTISPSSTVESIYTSTTSVTSITPKSSLSPDQDSSMQISASNNPYYSTSQDKPINVRQNENEPLNKRLTDNDFPIEKNTNPEIEKIEQEILNTLKRLGGNDEEDSVIYHDDGGDRGSNACGSDDAGGGANNLDTEIKKPYKKSEGFEHEN